MHSTVRGEFHEGPELVVDDTDISKIARERYDRPHHVDTREPDRDKTLKERGFVDAPSIRYQLFNH